MRHNIAINIVEYALKARVCDKNDRTSEKKNNM